MKRVVCIGECMVEHWEGEDPFAPQKFAGDTFNTAVYMARESSGHEIHFLTAVGQDDTSRNLLQAMRREDLKIDHVLARQDRTLGRYSIHTDERGERSFSYARAQSAARTLFDDPGSVQEMLNRIHPKLIYLSGISIAILPKPARTQLLTHLRVRDTLIAFDPNYRSALWENLDDARHWTQAFAGVSDFYLTSVEDDRALFGSDTSEEVAAHWATTFGGELVIKDGARPVTVRPADQSQSRSLTLPVIKAVQPVDTTGAGDAFNGAYMINRMMGVDPAESAIKAIGLCAKVIMNRGAILPR